MRLELGREPNRQPFSSLDFILAHHAAEYANAKDVEPAAIEVKQVRVHGRG